jgi:hypothetical protein
MVLEDTFDVSQKKNLDRDGVTPATIQRKKEQSVTSKDNESKQSRVDDETRARREFLKKVGKGSAVPAAALLLAASAKKAQASPSGACGGCGFCGFCGATSEL